VSVRVNLLPQEAAAKQEAARQRTAFAGGGLVLLLLLGLVYFWQVSRVDNARTELAAEEARADELRAEVAALSDFDELQRRQADAQEAVRTTLSGEVTFAGILQDVAAVMPSDAQMDSVSVSVGAPSTDDVTGRETMGSMTATGQTLTSHAPGVERVLLSLDKVVSFLDLHVSSSSLQDADEGIAGFTVEAQIGPEVLTRRYDDGLPEELR
jgi:Tfp pilus assembly protein PilN